MMLPVKISLSNAEAYLGPNQTSAIELFTKIVNGLSPLTIFEKKLHRRSKCLIGLEIRLYKLKRFKVQRYLYKKQNGLITVLLLVRVSIISKSLLTALNKIPIMFWFLHC